MGLIRRASLDDLDTLAPLYAAFFAEDAIPVDPPRIQTNLAQMLQDPRAAHWVAVEDDEIVGFAAASLSFGVEFGWSSEIEDLYLVPNARGRGWARRLFQTALDWAGAHGATEINLVVTPEAELDQGLTAFYMRFGFVDSRRILMHRNTDDAE